MNKEKISDSDNARGSDNQHQGEDEYQPTSSSISKNKKKTCIVKLENCQYTIVANDSKCATNVKGAKFSRSSSFTVLKHNLHSKDLSQLETEGQKTELESATTNSGNSTRCQHSGDDVHPINFKSQIEECFLEEYPPIHTPEALKAVFTRLKRFLNLLRSGENIEKEELKTDLEYVAKVSESLYFLDENLEDDDDILGVVETESVPDEVRQWLTLTFTRSSLSQQGEKDSLDKFKFRSVANAIRAGIMVDRIYRRMSSLTSFGATPEIESLLKKMDEWSFDVFGVGEKVEGHLLKYVGFELFLRFDFLNKFKISRVPLENFLYRLEQGYTKFGNTYHNQYHAADVAQTAAYIVSQSQLVNWMTDLEVFSVLIATLIHDYEHTGTTNTFHINIGSDLALLYNDRTVLENHHVSASFRLFKLEDCDILSGLKNDEYRDFRNMVIELVLATDMSNHFQQLKSVKSFLTQPDNIDKIQILSLIVHYSDISHPSKPWPLHHKWTELLLEEFFRQGDLEVALGLPVSPLCDRNNILVAESQIGFIDFIVEPTLLVLQDAILILVNSRCQQEDKPDSISVVVQKFKCSIEECITDNKTRWKDLAKKKKVPTATLR